MGKNISGAGFDPNITGRGRSPDWVADPMVKKIVVLGLTPQSQGNATGVGSADVITMRLYQQMDIGATYANVITSMSLGGAAIPLIMNTDRDAIALAVKSVVRVKPEDCRIVHIRNTLDLAEIRVSEPLIKEVKANPARFEIRSSAQPFDYDADGNLLGFSMKDQSLKSATG
jgi:hypothetical protein